MKLLFTCGNFPPSNYGGISSAMYSLVKELNPIVDFDIKVLTTSYKIPQNLNIKYNNWIEYNNIKVNYILTRFPNYSYNYIFRGFSEVRNVDKVFLNSIFFLPNLFFIVLAKYYNKKIYLLPHGELLKPALKNKKWKKIPYLKFLNIFKNNIDFIATSNQEKIEIQNLFPLNKIHLIPNFFELNRISNTCKENQFVFLGRICNIKKIDNLIKACKISLHFKANKYKLLIIGPTDSEYFSYKSYLKDLVTEYNLCENILFVNELGSPEKEIILSKSKTLFLVSESENFGNVVVESLAQGTPVVASKGTPWQILTNCNAGFWIDNDPFTISQIIDKLILMEKSEFELMSENAINISKLYTKELVIPKWVKIINE